VRALLLFATALLGLFGVAPRTAIAAAVPAESSGWEEAVRVDAGLPGPEIQLNLEIAEDYWETTPISHCLYIDVIVDQAKVFPYAELAEVGGCAMWVGDYFQAATRARRCAIETHAWGHLIGHHDEAGLPDDPLQVMASDAIPPKCAALDPPLDAAASIPASDPAPPPADTHAVSVWHAYDSAFTAWMSRRRTRDRCIERADSKRRRAARITARKACARRLPIHRPPAQPSVPRPADA
jgi:hypothetical protein